MVSSIREVFVSGDIPSLFCIFIEIIFSEQPIIKFKRLFYPSNRALRREQNGSMITKRVNNRHIVNIRDEKNITLININKESIQSFISRFGRKTLISPSVSGATKSKIKETTIFNQGSESIKATAINISGILIHIRQKLIHACLPYKA
jgi:hypothetical protein